MRPADAVTCSQQVKIETLWKLTTDQPYVLVGLGRGSPAPVAASAWGEQLKAPEPGAPCTGATEMKPPQ